MTGTGESGSGRLRRLILWRHGESECNADRRMQGQLDCGLTGDGQEQARRAAELLAGLRPQLLVTSDLRRAAGTAAALAAATGLAARPDRRLREIHLGRWQGLTTAEVEAGWPGALLVWELDAGWAPPGGETRLTAAARAAELVAELAAGPAEVAVLCAHRGLIRALAGRLLRLPPACWPSLGALGNCRWVVLDRAGSSTVDGSWQLAAYNAGPEPAVVAESGQLI